jgi:hypothetical protein
VEPLQPSEGLMDAGDFLAFTARLRDLRQRVDAAMITDDRRRRWHRRLADISGTGAEDLARAATQLNRFEAEVERQLGR